MRGTAPTKVPTRRGRALRQPDGQARTGSARMSSGHDSTTSRPVIVILTACKCSNRKSVPDEELGVLLTETVSILRRLPAEGKPDSTSMPYGFLSSQLGFM